MPNRHNVKSSKTHCTGRSTLSLWSTEGLTAVIQARVLQWAGHTLSWMAWSCRLFPPRVIQFRFHVRSDNDGSQGTVIGYDAFTQRGFVSRAGFKDASFSGISARDYYVALELNTQGGVSLRVLLDWSAVDASGGHGGEGTYCTDFPERGESGCFDID